MPGKPKGLRATKLYGVWKTMKSRCKPAAAPKDRERYFKNGITVCDEWSASFDAFASWAIANGYGPGVSIDRIDGMKGYSPDNCRWGTSRQQCVNRRSFKNSTSQYKGVHWHSGISGGDQCTSYLGVHAVRSNCFEINFPSEVQRVIR
jgi:hypothetical protein